MTGTTSSSDLPHKDEIKGRISGFRPATTGRICDATNARVSKGDRVFIELERMDGRGWELCRMHCEDAPMELDSSHPEACQAIVTAEIMQVDGPVGVLGNPEVEDVSDTGEARGEWKDVLEA